MARRLRDQHQLDAAIDAGNAPRAPQRGGGILLDIPASRPRRLVDDNGRLTAEGQYYYNKVGQEAPAAGFDWKQEPSRKGSKVQIKLLNGKTSAVRIWDGVNRQWRFTALGKKYYKESTDRYVITFPVLQTLIRYNGSKWEDETVLKSTATSIGEITLPTLMPEEEQLAEVKRRALAYIAALPVDDEGRKVLIEGGGSAAQATLMEDRELEYNREEILIRPDGSLTVSAVLHRPLRASKPWSFGFPGVCPEAYEETEGRCVPHQLEAVLERTLGLKAGNMDWLFDEIAEELYPPGSEDNPFDLEHEDGSIERRTWRQCGITVAMIVKFAEVHFMSVHVLFGHMKVLSFTRKFRDERLLARARGPCVLC